MTALRRLIDSFPVALAAICALLLAAPAAAQNSDAPIDVTAGPPPSAETVGPAQLRDFTLNGTVTRPADRPVATQPAPANPAPSASTPARTNSTPQPVPARTVTATTAQPRVTDVTPGALTDSTLPEVSEPLPGSVVALEAPPVSVAPTLPANASGFSPWPWVAALLALAGAGFYLMRSRRERRRRYDDFDRLAFAGPPEQQPELPRAAPTPAPKPDAGARPPWPASAKPAPQPAPKPKEAPQPASNGGIVSTRLKPELNVQFVPDRAVVTEREVMLQFDVTITNSGSAPARDLLVEGRMVTAHAAQDAEIAGFFAAPAGEGDRMALIPPLGRIALKSAVRLPLDQLHSFEVDGRRLFVPLVALNILFRSGAGEGHASASFLVGRGADEDEKLAPFRLDLGPRIFRGLSARPHSMGLQR